MTNNELEIIFVGTREDNSWFTVESYVGKSESVAMAHDSVELDAQLANLAKGVYGKVTKVVVTCH